MVEDCFCVYSCFQPTFVFREMVNFYQFLLFLKAGWPDLNTSIAKLGLGLRLRLAKKSLNMHHKQVLNPGQTWNRMFPTKLSCVSSDLDFWNSSLTCRIFCKCQYLNFKYRLKCLRYAQDVYKIRHLTQIKLF